MTLPEPAAPRKRRGFGMGLLIGLLVLVATLYSAGWFWLRMEAGRRLDAAAQSLTARGYTLTWRERTFGGYPFRLDADFTDLTIREPGGWAVNFPKLRAEAFVYRLDHWVADAPEGAVFTRPQGGPVRVTGRALRGSLRGLNQRPPSFSLEGRDLSFAPEPGALPFFLTSAANLQFHLRRSPDGREGGIFLQVNNARARTSGLFGQVAREQPVGLRADLIFTHPEALAGASWAQMVRNWSNAGGRVTVRQGGITAGDAVLAVSASRPLSVGFDGRLQGSLTASLRQAPRVIGAMEATNTVTDEAATAAQAVVAARQQGEEARITIDFQAGRTTLGPVAIGPAPKVY